MVTHFSNSNELHLKSTIGELPLFETSLDINSKSKEADKLFSSNPILPGIILYEDDKYVGMISRIGFYETFSRPYSFELYNSRTLQFMFENFIQVNRVMLKSSVEITEAVRLAMSRSKDDFTEPILVSFENGTIKLLDMYQLFLANSEINSLTMQAYKEANELKTEMLSIAAHDLKNPLNASISIIKILTQDLNITDEENKEYFGMLENSLKSMLNLISELLNSSVIETGKYTLKMQIIDLTELLAAIVYQNNVQAEKKHQLINFQYDKREDYLVQGDTMKIRESIENLVSNAIKYSPYDTVIDITLHKKNKFCAVTVRDSGPGLSEKDLKKLFGKFQRLTALPTGGESSTGLGLYIAKQIIDLHAGHIYAESELGKGSKFIIELPQFELESL